MTKKYIIVTGSAGFIGYSLCKFLLKNYDYKIVGIDIINNYYDKKIKFDRIKDLNKHKKFIFFKIDISKYKKLNDIFLKFKPTYVINLAAQAGVRFSIKNPDNYFKSNIVGFYNIITLSKKFNIKHLITASTSSVYGENKKFPIKENFDISKPIQFYAATKVSNEVIAHSFSYVYKLPITCLRFFTVYGPWGRPDMALFKFTKSILKKKPIEVFNYGNHLRDFTYIDDIVISISKLLKVAPKKRNIPYRVLNIGRGNPVKLMKFIKLIEKNLGLKAKINYKTLQKGDVKSTHSNSNKLFKLIKYKPKTDTKLGIKKFIDWYKNYYAYKK
mgnify:FL=1|tara:strand:- start:738 stop:1724 length:987 start_codon:yes stop_codon:yes gene_type:complete